MRDGLVSPPLAFQLVPPALRLRSAASTQATAWVSHVTRTRFRGGSGVSEAAPQGTEGLAESSTLQLFLWNSTRAEVAMSGLSRQLLWAAACLAALCTLTAVQGNSTVSPTVTSAHPSPTIPMTLQPVVTTSVPGGRQPNRLPVLSCSPA